MGILLRRRSGGLGGPGWAFVFFSYSSSILLFLPLFVSFPFSSLSSFIPYIRAPLVSLILALYRGGREAASYSSSSFSSSITIVLRRDSSNLFAPRGAILRLDLILRGHYVGRHRQVFGHVLVLSGIVPMTLWILPLVHLIVITLLIRGRVNQLSFY